MMREMSLKIIENRYFILAEQDKSVCSKCMQSFGKILRQIIGIVF
jgi:hypothetical protein